MVELQREGPPRFEIGAHDFHRGQNTLALKPSRRLLHNKSKRVEKPRDVPNSCAWANPPLGAAPVPTIQRERKSVDRGHPLQSRRTLDRPANRKENTEEQLQAEQTDEVGSRHPTVRIQHPKGWATSLHGGTIFFAFLCVESNSATGASRR
jgi:hypothetical protein